MFVKRAILSISIVVLASMNVASRASSSERLDRAMAFWESRLPYCEGFLSKEYSELDTRSDGQKVFRPCNDGDTILFGGLTCSVGDNRGCDAVKGSQGKDGRWWRSPRKLRLAEPDGGSETTFSNDHAAGVWAYIAQKRDVDAFRNWTTWIKKNEKLLGFIPKYCQDSRCAFKLMDCPMLDRLAVVLNTGNPICDAVPIPPLPIVFLSPTKTIHEIRNGFNDALKAVEKVPVAGKILNYEPHKVLTEKALAAMEKHSAKLEDFNSRIMVLARVSTDSAGVIGRLNAAVNDPGFSRHNIAVDAYLLQKYTAIPGPLTQDAARKVAAVEKQNAFMNFVAYGPNDRSERLILNKCRTKDPQVPRPRFQWIWERTDNDKSDPPRDTMYWDCLFAAKLHKGGPIQKVRLPTLPGMIYLYNIEQAAFAAAKARAEKGIALINEMIKKPTLPNVAKGVPAAAELPAAVAGEAAGAAAQGAVTPIAGKKAGKAAADTTKAAVNPVGAGREKLKKVCKYC